MIGRTVMQHAISHDAQPSLACAPEDSISIRPPAPDPLPLCVRWRFVSLVRRATIGSRSDARRAGQRPKNTPTTALNAKARTMAGAEINVFQFARVESAMAPPTPQDAEDATQHAKHNRLDKELQKDVQSRGTQRHAHSNLPCAFGDRNQHDIHDADAADQEAHGGDAPEQERERCVVSSKVARNSARFLI